MGRAPSNGQRAKLSAPRDGLEKDERLLPDSISGDVVSVLGEANQPGARLSFQRFDDLDFHKTAPALSVGRDEHRIGIEDSCADDEICLYHTKVEAFRSHDDMSGGIGVREGLLIEALRIQPAIGVQMAVIAAILLRIVWFVTEVLVSAVLYWGVGRKEPRP